MNQQCITESNRSFCDSHYECDKSPMSHYLPTTIDLLPYRLILEEVIRGQLGHVKLRFVNLSFAVIISEECYTLYSRETCMVHYCTDDHMGGI